MEFPRTVVWLYKVDVTMSGVDEGWLGGQMTGAMRIGGEDVAMELKAAARSMGDGHFSRKDSVWMGIAH